MADDEFVVVLWLARASELKRCEELEPDYGDHDDGKGEKNVSSELTLSRISVVNLSDEEEISQADSLSVQDIGSDVESVESLRDILTGEILEERNDRFGHEESIHVRCRSAGRRIDRSTTSRGESVAGSGE